MRVRWIGLALALALVGAAAGYGIAHATRDLPMTASAEPMPAVSPSYPVNEYSVAPDPETAPLATDLPLRPVRLNDGTPRLHAEVPVGWQRVGLAGGQTWNFSVFANPTNTYVLRIGLLVGTRQSVTVAKGARISALNDAEANGGLSHLVIEADDDDSFVATYVDNGDYRRVTMERFIPYAGSTSAFASVAITGREVDRPGMVDLLDRVSATVHP